MNNSQTMEQEKGVLRWGGLAGMLGGLLFLLALVVVIVGPVGMEEPADLAEMVARFPDIKAARVVENVVYLVALILGVILFLALYQALRQTSLASALFGSALGILGLVAMVVSATPHVAQVPLSELYHAPEATPGEQEIIALLWQAVWGINDRILYVGFFTVPLGLVVLGAGMIGSPAFGKGFGWVSVALGMVGFVAAVVQMSDPASMLGMLTYFAIIISHFVLGYKVYSLSRAFGDLDSSGKV